MVQGGQGGQGGQLVRWSDGRVVGWSGGQVVRAVKVFMMARVVRLSRRFLLSLWSR